MKKLAILLTLLLAGCGNNFEWFPSGTFNNSSTSTLPQSNAGKIAKTIPYPGGITWVMDAAYDGNGNLWLLNGTSLAPTAISKLDVLSGQLTGARVNKFSWSVNITDGSTMGYDGSSFWVAGNAKSGVTAGEIYQIGAGGVVVSKYDCPSSATEFCRGVAWDPGTGSFWSAASDNNDLVNYQVAGNGALASSKSYPGLWPSGDVVTDVAFDSATGTTMIIKGGVVFIRAGAVTSTATFDIPGSGRGDWDEDSQLLWIVDNTNKVINGIQVK